MLQSQNNLRTDQAATGVEMLSKFQTIICLNKSNDEQTVVSIVSSLSASTTQTQTVSISDGPLRAKSRYNHLYNSPGKSKRKNLKFLQEKRDRLQASSDDIFDRLYKLSKPMQQEGKEMRRRYTSSRDNIPRSRQLNIKTKERVLPKLRSSLAYRDEKDTCTRLYKQGMLSMRKLEERRAKCQSSKSRQF